MIRRIALASAIASIGVLALAGSVSAHIEPDPSEAQAGANLTVGFTVEHGCDGSPTIEIEMRLPEGVTDGVPEPLDGWTESIDDEGIVTFTDGSLAADAEGTFEVTMTLPPTPDTTIYFPLVQRCEVGEIRWIGLPDDSGDEPDEPAPAVDLVGPVVTTTAPATSVPDTTVPTTDAPSETTAATTPETTTATSVPDDTTPDDTIPDDTTPDDTVVINGVDEDGSSSTGTIVFIVSILAVLVIGAIVYFAARRSRTSTDSESPTDVGDI